MALSERKITADAISIHGVVSAPDRMTGTAVENKKVFDRLVREVVSQQVNALIDELTSVEEGDSGAGDIGVAGIAGVSGTNVQAVLEEMKQQFDELERVETELVERSEVAAESAAASEEAAAASAETAAEASVHAGLASADANRAADIAERAMETAATAASETSRMVSEAKATIRSGISAAQDLLESTNQAAEDAQRAAEEASAAQESAEAAAASAEASKNAISALNVENGKGAGSLQQKGCTADGESSFAEGYGSKATGDYAHAEGQNWGTRNCLITGEAGATTYHVIAMFNVTLVGQTVEYNGVRTIVTDCDPTAKTITVKDTLSSSALDSVNVRVYSSAFGEASHVEGTDCSTGGSETHAEGLVTSAFGSAAHSEGHYTIAAGEHQHVQGRFNVVDADNTYAHIVGNGTLPTERSNAHTIDWDGNAWFAGEVYVGSASGTNRDDGSERLARMSDIAKVSTDVEAVRGDVSKLVNNSVIVDVSGEVLSVADSSDMELMGLKLFGKTTQNGTPSPDAPVPLMSVGNSGSVGVTVAGKNWIDKNSFVQGGLNSNDGTETTTATRLRSPYVPVATNHICTLSLTDDSVVTGYRVYFYDRDKNFIAFQSITSIPYIFDLTAFEKPVCYIRVLLHRTDDADIDVSMLPDGVQLEVGSTATACEPYKPAQTLTAQTPNGLPGIPVTSGGNYTDANGQQWVCDEVDFARGVYVQRVGKLVLDGNGVTWTVYNNTTLYNGSLMKDVKKPNYGRIHALCNAIPKAEGYYYLDTAYAVHSGDDVGLQFQNVLENFGLSECTSAAFNAYLTQNPITFIYKLATPIETALPDEEIAAFKSLHTNRPNTTVCNDSGAGMEMEYIADTKIYIDNKFSALQNAILSAGANV